MNGGDQTATSGHVLELTRFGGGSTHGPGHGCDIGTQLFFDWSYRVPLATIDVSERGNSMPTLLNTISGGYFVIDRYCRLEKGLELGMREQV
jgi:hypothetical protein